MPQIVKPIWSIGPSVLVGPLRLIKPWSIWFWI